MRRLSAIALVLVSAWLAGLVLLGMVVGAVQRGDSFNIVHWEVTQLTGYTLSRLRRMVAPGSTRSASTAATATDEEVGRYFKLLRQARALRAQTSAATQPTARAAIEQSYAVLLRQVDALALRVQARYEQALEVAVQNAGLVTRLPLYTGVSLVWPPVATGFSVPPHILIISPRDHIELKDTRLLRTDLTLADTLRIEHDAEKSGVSALVDQIGGLGAYPSIADRDDSPLGLMQTVAHEWMHEYLVFHPLGARYAESGDLTFINETVAELVGRELGSAAFDVLGLPGLLQGAGPTQPPSRPPGLDFNTTMHDLRLQVDALLKDGHIDAAEQRMNETQQLLAANGYAIRRINQAYFAFYGSYGTNAAASNPLAARIDSIRRESPTLLRFVQLMQNVVAPADIDRILRSPVR